MKTHFTLTAQFAVRPETLYQAWLSSKRHSEMTGSAAKVQARVGGRFSAWMATLRGRPLSSSRPHESCKRGAPASSPRPIPIRGSRSSWRTPRANEAYTNSQRYSSGSGRELSERVGGVVLRSDA